MNTFRCKYEPWLMASVKISTEVVNLASQNWRNFFLGNVAAGSLASSTSIHPYIHTHIQTYITLKKVKQKATLQLMWTYFNNI